MTSSPTPAVLPDARARTRAVSERLVAEMRRVARQDGWALAVHGSMSRDLDLIAVPWTDQATDETAFVEAMRASMARTLGGIALIGAGEDGRTPGVKAKPHGRRSWTIHSTSEQLVETEAGAHPYIDLCVLDFRVGAALDSDWAGDWQGDTLSERARSMAAIRVAATATPPASDAAVPAGMKPWHGGNAAPDDWNGGPVHYANGITAQPLDQGDWQRPADIPLIAYTPQDSSDAIRAVTAEMRRLMPNSCGDWADKIDAMLAAAPKVASDTGTALCVYCAETLPSHDTNCPKQEADHA